MTSRTLWRIVAATVGLLVVYAGIGAYAYSVASQPPPYFKDFVPLVVGASAVVLTAAFQRRISYLQALRDFWRQFLPAVQAAIQYTHLGQPTAAQFAEAYKGMATVVDA